MEGMTWDKLVHYTALVFVIASIAVIAACKPEEPPEQNLVTRQVSTQTSSPTSTATASSTVSPTPSPTWTATWTPAPSSTPTPSSTPERLSCLDEGGHYEQSEVRTDLLPLPLSYRVYLPPCYAQLEDSRYPVLYLIHGQNYNDDQWDRLGMDEAADRMIASGEIAPLLIVMPRDRSWSQPTEDKFGQVVVELLIPHIDQNYRTRPQREYRAIGGLSRGAAWALHLGFSSWETFSTVGMHSLPVFWTDLPEIRNWLAAIPRQSLPRIYMDLGDKDRPQISKSAIWFEELLTEQRIPHEWHLYPGYHEEAYWQEHVEEYLRWYTQNW